MLLVDNGFVDSVSLSHVGGFYFGYMELMVFINVKYQQMFKNSKKSYSNSSLVYLISAF